MKYLLKMKMTPSKINRFNIFKLPLVFLSGVRVKFIDDESCKVNVRYRWINQNPFKSMFWAVQGMAAELTTGALLLSKIRESGKSISMLVANNNASFCKKAIGKITFVCKEGASVDKAIGNAIKTGEGQTVWLRSVGTNEDGAEVSCFNFEWTIKVKS